MQDVAGSAAGFGPAAGAVGALGAAALWAFGSFLFERAMAPRAGVPAVGPAAANLFKNATATLVLGVAWFALGARGPGAAAWGSLAVSGLLGFAVGDALYFAAFPRCGVQVAALGANLIPPLAALLDWWLFGRTLSALALVGMAVTLGGIALVVTEAPRARAGAVAVDAASRRTGILFAACAAVAQAVAIVAGREGFASSDLLPGTVARLAGGVGGALVIAVVLGLVARARGRPASGPAHELRRLARPFALPRLAWLLVPGCLVGAWLNLPLHSLGLANLDAGISGVLFATTPLFTLPIGLALGHRYGWRTALGTAIAFAGVVCVIQGS